MIIPIAQKIPYITEINKKKINDDYAWLRDKNWPQVTDEKILNYLKEENQYYDHFIKPLELEKNKIFNELKGRIKLEDKSVPVKRDNYYYYNRMEEKGEYPIYCRKKDSLDAPEEIILDINLLAKDKKYTAVPTVSVSPDHKLLAYSIDHEGNERFTIKLYNLETKEYLTDEIKDTIGRIVWHEKLLGFFYTPTDESWRVERLMYHQLGTAPENDLKILYEPGGLYTMLISKSASKDYLFIDIHGHQDNEIYVLSLVENSFNPILVRARIPEVYYSLEHHDQNFYILTNDHAPNFKIMTSPVNNLSQWNEYITEKKDAYLTSFDVSTDYLVLNYRKLGLPLIQVQDFSNREIKTINFPDSAFSAICGSTNFKENNLRITYSSLSRPWTTYSYDFTTESLEVLKTQQIPSGFNPEEYEVERQWADNDGTKIPLSIFYKKSLFKKDGSNPLYLYGYGSYGISIPPTFSNSAVTFADRGFVYVIAHIRGGDDLGKTWHESAKFLNKKRTFDDFIQSAEYLIKEKYTNKGNIVSSGASAGGMLIGAVINQRPELFKAVIAHVPFVDVLNTMLDDTLPLTPGEYKEWGNPQDPEYYEYMYSYSPYENIKPQDYPTILVTAGLSDPRVTYWEPAKWVAKLRAVKTDKNLILFKTNMGAGHGGVSGRFAYLNDVAEELAFIFQVFSIKN